MAMARKKYVVELSADERRFLKDLLKQKRVAAKKRTRAQILLKVDEGEEGPHWSHAEAAEALDVHVNTVTAVAKKFVESGFEAAIHRKKHSRPGRTTVIAGEVEKTLVALATGKPPKGHAYWTLRLLADRLVELEAVGSVSHETVRKALVIGLSQMLFTGFLYSLFTSSLPRPFVFPTQIQFAALYDVPANISISTEDSSSSGR
ncbi:MAG: helix-turn-helix domain-containing protein [Candidatus Eisenbacteria bacterium]|nr:helix-turn-helix domain-containing protein [Candidatus Eisenbacteria bacterium]